MNDHQFVIDLARCTGCQTCSIACKDRANLPDDLDWLHVKGCEGGSYPAPTFYYRVMHCFHCAEPACVDVCPVAALSQQADGRILIDADLCTGCGNCIDACPFSAVVMLPSGVASKCDGCADELEQDWEPTCVRACLMRALQYEVISTPLPEKRVADTEFDDHGIGPSVLYLRWSGE